MPDRRTVLRALAAGALTSLSLPGLLLAAAPTERRLVVVILRGGLDGLAAVPAYGDPAYHSQRGPLALARPGEPGGVLDLDGFFGLHPALGALQTSFGRGELTIVHAAATPYRERSHFSAQDVLENGTSHAESARDGWLNRALGALRPGPAVEAVAVGLALPLLLQGAAPATALPPTGSRPAEAGLYELVAALYQDDPLLGPALARGLAARATMDERPSLPDRLGRSPSLADHRRPSLPDRLSGPPSFTANASLAGAVLGATPGARVAVLDAIGFDTHAHQGTVEGGLARRLAEVADGLQSLEQGLGAAWRQTAVLVVTEFGRTVAANGSGGTDHGTAGSALLLGGAVAGGQILADWPGLREERLYQSRDLAPTTDLRSLFKGVLMGHLGLDAAILEDRVFPDSRAARPLQDLIRT